ncbi:MAG: tRNA lysidine(34) synthetase TilS, partial [Pseudomonadota bacterium]|nr:tRNA lysidine(34) synthetase TilS [Pseudomonadota bacterium]
MAPMTPRQSLTPLTGAAFVKKLAALTKLSKNKPAHFALAVSGGADSLSLVVLAAEAKKKNKQWNFSILTVNHGLRRAAVQETRYVFKLAKASDLVCKILTHKGAIPENDIQSTARDIRYGLMFDWCHKNKVDYLVTAHHLEDQAETFLLRLARGSGLDGLSGMQRVRNSNGVALLR